MAKIKNIEWETNPSEFLNPEKTKQLAQSFTSGKLTKITGDISNQINSDMDKGLSVDALSIEGRAPLNEIAQEMLKRLEITSTDLDSVGNEIISAGNNHTVEEVETYYDKVMKEYNKRKDVLREAVDNYNSNLQVPVKSGKKDENGNVLKETLSKIKLINGEDDNYQKVIISGKRDSRNKYYSAVSEALSKVEEMYPKPEEANRYKAKWGNLSSSEKPITPNTADDMNANTGWGSYEDAANEGYTIMTPEEFEERKPKGYKSYQDYLKAMYQKYVVNVKYKPEIKTGKIDTQLTKNDGKTIFATVKYEGEYIEYYNEDGIKVRAPLAIAKYVDGEIVYVPMTENQKKKYINKVTQYYNDVMDNKKLYSDKFKEETGKRVESVTMVYIDPDSRENIQAADQSAAYCSKTNGYSNRSDIVIYSDEFLNFDDKNSYNNHQWQYDYMLEAYTHENGHAYANNKRIFKDRDTNATWKSIYDQVTSKDVYEVNKETLREYSLSNKYELFADSTDYYFHQPDRLKNVEINIDVDGKKYETLYEYMDYVLN